MAAADALHAHAGARLLSSPMRRCRETADPFQQRTGTSLQLETRVGEVATPAGVEDRRAWLAGHFPWRGDEPATWDSLTDEVRIWRDNVLACVRSLGEDAVVFTHFVAINAVVGAALQRTETVVCAPDFASITELAVEAGVLRLVSLGAPMSEGEVR